MDRWFCRSVNTYNILKGKTTPNMFLGTCSADPVRPSPGIKPVHEEVVVGSFVKQDLGNKFRVLVLKPKYPDVFENA